MTTLLVALRPVESVAVREISRDAGYSWSGATNEPLDTPENVWSGWSWHSGHSPWWRTIDHDNPDGGIGSPLLSVAEPENEIVLPTAHVVLDVGDAIVTLGRPTPIVTESVSDAPSGSVTLSEAT
jgi:hypothetical protein